MCRDGYILLDTYITPIINFILDGLLVCVWIPSLRFQAAFCSPTFFFFFVVVVVVVVVVFTRFGVLRLLFNKQ